MTGVTSDRTLVFQQTCTFRRSVTQWPEHAVTISPRRAATWGCSTLHAAKFARAVVWQGVLQLARSLLSMLAQSFSMWAMSQVAEAAEGKSPPVSGYAAARAQEGISKESPVVGFAPTNFTDPRMDRPRNKHSSLVKLGGQNGGARGTDLWWCRRRPRRA